MDQTFVPRDRLDLQDVRSLVSPPFVAEPLYQCATAVTVYGFVPEAVIDIEVDGVVVTTAQVGFPEPVGATLGLTTALAAGGQLRVRQRTPTAQSDWSGPVTVRDHTQDYPAGPPRPQIAPAPVHACGVRTGVGNLLAGGNVWVTADAAEVGRVIGCAPTSGVNVVPPYGLGNHVRAWFELCADPSPPSLEHVAQPPPLPLVTPGFDPIYEGAQQVRITGIANGARIDLYRDGASLGASGCWGGSFLWTVPSVTAGQSFVASQTLCPGDPTSPTGTTTVQPCSALPPPEVGPIQAGDSQVWLKTVPGAVARVYVNGVQAGLGSAPMVLLNQTVSLDDVVIVVQDLGGCRGQTAVQSTVACVDAPTTYDPSGLDLFPVGSLDYEDGGTRGSVFYPADDDGEGTAFNARLASGGRVPIVFMAHGNHSPADPSFRGYDYLQQQLARMGMVAVSVDCNALNGSSGGVSNIEARADLIIDSISYFQGADATPGSPFAAHLDFGRVGLLGHSRGGDAVVTLAAVLPLPNVQIRGVLALAPTNFRFWYGLPTIAPSRYAFMTILPAGDGDVRETNGAQFYDQAAPDPFRSQLYVFHANHNFFNRQWADDDGSGPPTMARAEHERVLSAYGSAFFRSVLLAHDTIRFLVGSEKPAGVLSANVHLAFGSARSEVVDHHDDRNGIATNSLGHQTQQTGGLSADEFPFAQVGAFNDSFFGETVGMIAPPGGPTRTFRSELRGRDLRGREVWIRAAEVYEGSVPPDATGFEVGVEDGNGLVSWVPSSAVGGLARPYDRRAEDETRFGNDLSKTMLSTLRFHSACFVSKEPRLDLGDVQALLIRCDRPDERALAFDDLEIVGP